MSSLFNPYALTALGKPLQQRQAPELRVETPYISRAQLDMAQHTFVRFLGQARLSRVPNPTEQGRLADGTPYRIVTASGAPIMQVWPIEIEIEQPVKSDDQYGGFIFKLGNDYFIIDVRIDDMSWGRHLHSWRLSKITEMPPLENTIKGTDYHIIRHDIGGIPYLYSNRDGRYYSNGVMFAYFNNEYITTSINYEDDGAYRINLLTDVRSVYDSFSVGGISCYQAHTQKQKISGKVKPNSHIAPIKSVQIGERMPLEGYYIGYEGVSYRYFSPVSRRAILIKAHEEYKYNIFSDYQPNVGTAGWTVRVKNKPGNYIGATWNAAGGVQHYEIATKRSGVAVKAVIDGEYKLREEESIDIYKDIVDIYPEEFIAKIQKFGKDVLGVSYLMMIDQQYYDHSRGPSLPTDFRYEDKVNKVQYIVDESSPTWTRYKVIDTLDRTFYANTSSRVRSIRGIDISIGGIVYTTEVDSTTNFQCVSNYKQVSFGTVTVNKGDNYKFRESIAPPNTYPTSISSHSGDYESFSDMLYEYKESTKIGKYTFETVNKKINMRTSRHSTNQTERSARNYDRESTSDVSVDNKIIRINRYLPDLDLLIYTEISETLRNHGESLYHFAEGINTRISATPLRTVDEILSAEVTLNILYKGELVFKADSPYDYLRTRVPTNYGFELYNTNSNNNMSGIADVELPHLNPKGVPGLGSVVVRFANLSGNSAMTTSTASINYYESPASGAAILHIELDGREEFFAVDKFRFSNLGVVLDELGISGAEFIKRMM